MRVILTDIEGTTSAISFVHEVLFPYARQHMRRFVDSEGGREDVQALLRDVRREAGLEDGVDVIGVLLSWIDEDRKVTALKALQGLIWEHGYQSGELKGHMYEDAVSGFRRWHEQGLKLFVYSSGSVYAQKLLFGHTEHGDLTGMFSGYFDTKIGHKREVPSYQAICSEIGCEPSDVLFLSDVGEELDAAKAAGLGTVQLIREESIVPADGHRKVTTFDEISVET